MQWAGEEYLLEEVIDEAGDRFEKPGEVYSEELIYWIGYDAESPRELSEEQLWAKDGRMIDCEYIKLIKPIKHSQYKEIILKYCNVKYAPFDKDGNGNMGYLFDLNRELARFFVENAIVENEHLLEVESVQDLVK